AGHVDGCRWLVLSYRPQPYASSRSGLVRIAWSLKLTEVRKAGEPRRGAPLDRGGMNKCLAVCTRLQRGVTANGAARAAAPAGKGDPGGDQAARSVFDLGVPDPDALRADGHHAEGRGADSDADRDQLPAARSAADGRQPHDRYGHLASCRREDTEPRRARVTA